MTKMEYDKWVKLYDKLQYSNPKEVDVVWTKNLYDINFLKRNKAIYYEHLLKTKESIQWNK